MKIGAEGAEVVIRMTAQEAESFWGGDLSGVVACRESAAAAIAVASRASALWAMDQDRIDAARLAFEEERAQARKDYGVTSTEPEKTAARCPCCFTAGISDAAHGAYRCPSLDCPVFRFRDNIPLWGGPTSDRLADLSHADADQERADRLFPDREGRVEGVDR